MCAGRGIPTGLSPERSLRAAPGVFSLSSLFLEENFLLTRPPTSTHTQVYRTRSEKTKLSYSPPGTSRVGMQTFPGSSEDFIIVTKTQTASAVH